MTKPIFIFIYRLDFLTSSAIEVTTLLQILQKKKVFSTFSHRVLLNYWFRYIVIYKTKTEKKMMASSKHLIELDDEIGFISHVNGRSDSCDAIQEVDEEADLELDGM